MILHQSPRRGPHGKSCPNCRNDWHLRNPARPAWSLRECPAWVSSARRGAATLEFAIVLPVLVLLLTGIMEFGRVALLAIPIAEAARTGAMYGAMNPPDAVNPNNWAQQCELRAREVLANQTGINPSLVTVQCTYATGSPLNRSTVQVGYPFTLMIGWSPAPSSLVIQRTAVFPVIR